MAYRSWFILRKNFFRLPLGSETTTREIIDLKSTQLVCLPPPSLGVQNRTPIKSLQ